MGSRAPTAPTPSHVWTAASWAIRRCTNATSFCADHDQTSSLGYAWSKASAA